jgi:hypothetical protein
MNLRNWLLACVLVAVVAWWVHRTPAPPAAADGATVSCPAPPRVPAGEPPLQSEVPAGVAEFRLRPATLRPLAGFSIDARVLSREDYSTGRESDLSPTDLALGWGPMRDEAVVSRLDISQSSRWYHYKWRDAPPIAVDLIVRSSANMHMIPSDAAAAAELARVRSGDRVRIDGWLVEAVAPDGWHWRSSTSREDSGGGACEVVYVCSITRE